MLHNVRKKLCDKEASDMLDTRDYAAPVFDSLTDSQLMDFLRLFADDNTLARIESDMIAAGVETKRYNSFKELLQEIEDDDDDDDD
jgi:hypothetical protein